MSVWPVTWEFHEAGFVHNGPPVVSSLSHTVPCIKGQFNIYLLMKGIRELNKYSLSIFLIDLYWSKIASQYCVSFCFTPK